MSRINQLSEHVANAIAAGEVVERPVSVVKELIENALDAGATSISVEIEDGGIKLIRIIDNGCGMDQEDAVKAFSCHATSKINQLEDLESIFTMGFRGEALASISAVSKVDLSTCMPEQNVGTQVKIEGGKHILTSEVAGVRGTSITVRDLFFNQPARYKFLKKDHTEAQYITILCERFVMIRPDVSFKLINNGKQILMSPGNGSPIDALYCVYGAEVVEQTISVDYTQSSVDVRGFAGKPAIARKGRGEQTVFVNDRLIRSKTISAAIEQAYRPYLMKGRFAFVVLFVNIPSALVDVNVHPQKSEVRFWNDSEVFRAVFHGIQNALKQSDMTSEPSRFSGEPMNTKHKDVSKVGHYLVSEEKNISDSNGVKFPAEDSMLESSENNHSMHSAAGKSMPHELLEQNFFHNRIGHEMPLAFNASDFIKVSPTVLPFDNTNRQVEMSVDQPMEPSSESGEPDKDKRIALIELMEARFVGVLFATYILLESDSAFLIIDQHAAHEKILYERLSDRNRSKDYLKAQYLLTPQLLRLTRAEVMLVQAHQERLRDLAFDIDLIGDFEVTVRAIPSFARESDIGLLVHEVLQSLDFKNDYLEQDVYHHLATAACKAAVKANDRLDVAEVQGLIKDLVGIANPYHCPHGRPIIVRYEKSDIEKWFKRIV